MKKATSIQKVFPKVDFNNILIQNSILLKQQDLLQRTIFSEVHRCISTLNSSNSFDRLQGSRNQIYQNRLQKEIIQNNQFRDSILFNENMFRKGFELGMGSSLGVVLVILTYQSINTEEKRTHILLSMRAGFDPTLKAVQLIYNWIKEKVSKRNNKKGEGEEEKSNPFDGPFTPKQKFLLSNPLIVGVITLLILIGVFRPQDGKNSSIPNLPVFFPKKKLTNYEKFKEFISPIYDFSRPYPYIIIIAGGLMAYFYVSPNVRSRSTDALIAVSKNLSDLTESQFNKFVLFIENTSKSMKEATGKTITTLESFIKTDNTRMDKMDVQIAKLEEALKHTTFHDQQMSTAAVIADMKLGQCMNELSVSYANLDSVNLQNKLIEETMVEVISIASNNNGPSNSKGQLTLPVDSREVQQRIETKREQMVGKNQKMNPKQYVQQVEERFQRPPLPDTLEKYLEEQALKNVNPKGKKK